MIHKIKNNFSTWFSAERVDRVEKGTSQDMCPTNGSALLYRLVMFAAWGPLMIYLAVCFYLGIDPIRR